MEQTNKQSGRIIAIIAMMFIYAMISFVTNLAAPIGVIWKNQPELMGSNTLGMMGNMMNFLAYLFMGIPAGKLLIKIGYKRLQWWPLQLVLWVCSCSICRASLQVLPDSGCIFGCIRMRFLCMYAQHSG